MSAPPPLLLQVSMLVMPIMGNGDAADDDDGDHSRATNDLGVHGDDDE